MIFNACGGIPGITLTELADLAFPFTFKNDFDLIRVIAEGLGNYFRLPLCLYSYFCYYNNSACLYEHTKPMFCAGNAPEMKNKHLFSPAYHAFVSAWFDISSFTHYY
jgi:hypothetical protein